jgi:hypothetical protein
MLPDREKVVRAGKRVKDGLLRRGLAEEIKRGHTD